MPEIDGQQHEPKYPWGDFEPDNQEAFAAVLGGLEELGEFSFQDILNLVKAHYVDGIHMDDAAALGLSP